MSFFDDGDLDRARLSHEAQEKDEAIVDDIFKNLFGDIPKPGEPKPKPDMSGHGGLREKIALYLTTFDEAVKTPKGKFALEEVGRSIGFYFIWRYLRKEMPRRQAYGFALVIFHLGRIAEYTKPKFK